MTPSQQDRLASLRRAKELITPERKPRKHILPLTYEPKIIPVRDGDCTQTIRGHNPEMQVDDLISFHGWEGRAYHSKWSFRTPYWKVADVSHIAYVPERNGWMRPLYLDTVFMESVADDPKKFYWKAASGLVLSDTDVGIIAKNDFIDPPIARKLTDVLKGKNGQLCDAEIFDVIQWWYND